MAFIKYLPEKEVPKAHRVSDRDNILRIHSIHSAVTPIHYQLFKELMYAPGPLSRVQREMIAVTVSAANQCHY